MDPKFVQKVREGNNFYIEETNWPTLEACAKSDVGSLGDDLLNATAMNNFTRHL